MTEYQQYHVEFLGNLVFDDLVWHQSIVSLERLQTFRGGLRADPDDAVFWSLLMRGVLTGGKGVFTQWVHCEFIVSSESIRPQRTHQAHDGFFLKVPINLPIKNPAGTC